MPKLATNLDKKESAVLLIVVAATGILDYFLVLRSVEQGISLHREDKAQRKYFSWLGA